MSACLFLLSFVSFMRFNRRSSSMDQDQSHSTSLTPGKVKSEINLLGDIDPMAPDAALPDQALEQDLVPIPAKDIPYPAPGDDAEIDLQENRPLSLITGYGIGIAVFLMLIRLYFSRQSQSVPADNGLQADIDLIYDDACNFEQIPEPEA